MTVKNLPEVPVLSITAPTAPFVIIAGVTKTWFDTGYRLSASDDDGDKIKLRLKEKENRFRIKHKDEVWIKRDQRFDEHSEPEISVHIRAVEIKPEDNDPSTRMVDKQTILFRVVGRDGQLDVTSVGLINVKENAVSNNNPSVRGGADVVYVAKALRGDAAHTVTWQLGGQDATTFGINDQGKIWFRESPDYESTKKSYNFDLVASAAKGQLIDRETVTINITDVDEVPSEMRLGATEKTLHTSFDTSAGKKLTTIKFNDDALGENRVLIDPSQLFEIRHDKLNGHLQLWLKPDAKLWPGKYEIEIRPFVSSAVGEGGAPPKAEIFTLTVTALKVDVDNPVMPILYPLPFFDEHKVPESDKDMTPPPTDIL